MIAKTGRKGADHASPVRDMLVDTHVHLNSPEFAADRAEVLARARAAGVQRFLCPGYDPASSRAAADLARAGGGIVAAVGVHPHDARLYADAVEAELDAMLAEPGVVAIGETGLDYHYDHSPRDVQQAVLSRQLALARRHQVPVVVHNRESDADMIRILTAEAAGLRIVLHAFTGSAELAALHPRLDLYFGIGGFLTFPKHALADRVAGLPRQALLLETDAPYLSPHPLRGRRNEPARIEIIARRLADLLGMPLDQVADLTTQNFRRFLGEP
jgi:TatD DNase family protein